MATVKNAVWLGTERRAGPTRRTWISLASMLRAIETRRLLAEMDDRMLADIGASRADAVMESRRAPWDVM